MARIIVVTHEFDAFVRRSRFWTQRRSDYLLFQVLRRLQNRGHSWRIAVGPHATPGDVAILHVDCTFVDADYIALGAHYPITINFGASDISKRRVSGAQLSQDADWTGPVIVKTNLNYGGRIEAAHNDRAMKAGRPPPHAAVKPVDDYTILPSVAAVEASVWEDASMVVDRFLPEVDEEGFAMRTWVFMGQRERCSRHVSKDPVVKAYGSIRRTPVEIPDALRAERARLGFDYGKFDFVMQDGRPILLDANRTPGRSPASGQVLQAGLDLLADGLLEIIRSAL